MLLLSEIDTYFFTYLKHAMKLGWLLGACDEQGILWITVH